MKWFFSVKARLAVSLLTGLAVAVAVSVYLRSAQKKIQEHYVMTRVLVARRYIAQGKTVTESLVEGRDIPVAYVQPTALRSLAELQDREGKFAFRTSVGLLKDEQVTRSKVNALDAFQGLAWSLAPGQTALSFSLPPERAVAGLLQPGDYVNVFVSLDQEKGNGRPLAQLLFSQIPVAAVGDSVWDPSAPAIKNESKGMANENILITLRLTPRQAALGVLAAEKGKISLTLASPLETESLSGLKVEMTDF